MPDIFSAISDTVVFLFTGDPPLPIGTAFVVGYPHPTAADRIFPVIVTAKHVLGDHGVVLARFSPRPGERGGFGRYELAALRGARDYWEHPDPGVDLAAFRSPHFEQAQYRALPLQLVATKPDLEGENIKQTDRVMFPSLLVNFMGLERNYPVIRDGSIALIPDERVPMKYNVGAREIETQQEIILLEATSVPGASGSPIFLWPGPRIRGTEFVLGGRLLLVGIMHGFYSALPRDLIEVGAAEPRRMFSENSGIAIAFPSWRLREVFDLPEMVGRFTELAAGDA